jgi:hypothetical protein
MMNEGAIVFERATSGESIKFPERATVEGEYHDVRAKPRLSREPPP